MLSSHAHPQLCAAQPTPWQHAGGVGRFVLLCGMGGWRDVHGAMDGSPGGSAQAFVWNAMGDEDAIQQAHGKAYAIPACGVQGKDKPGGQK